MLGAGVISGCAAADASLKSIAAAYTTVKEDKDLILAYTMIRIP
jgi:hypothetical protein